jgi:mRNA interferase RelE/StbE
VYEIYIERRPERDLKRVPSKEFDRIIRAIRALAEEPRPTGCRKIEGSKSDWRIRVGDYRVVYEIDDGAQTIRVMRIRHRSGVYR